MIAPTLHPRLAWRLSERLIGIEFAALQVRISSMDILHGFQLEVPNVFIPWGITPRKLVKLLGPHPVHIVSEDYFFTSCVSLNGLSHQLGFHFDPRSPWKLRLNRRLFDLEIFLSEKQRRDISESFPLVQEHLERTFGPPTEKSPGYEDFPTYRWNFSQVFVGHSVYERFVIAEGIRIWNNRGGRGE